MKSVFAALAFAVAAALVPGLTARAVTLDPDMRAQQVMSPMRVAQACLSDGDWCGGGGKCCAGFTCVTGRHEGKPYKSCERAQSKSCAQKLDACQQACGSGTSTSPSGKPPESWKRCFAACGERFPDC